MLKLLLLFGKQLLQQGQLERSRMVSLVQFSLVSLSQDKTYNHHRNIRSSTINNSIQQHGHHSVHREALQRLEAHIHRRNRRHSFSILLFPHSNGTKQWQNDHCTICCEFWILSPCCTRWNTPWRYAWYRTWCGWNRIRHGSCGIRIGMRTLRHTNSSLTGNVGWLFLAKIVRIYL